MGDFVIEIPYSMFKAKLSFGKLSGGWWPGVPPGNRIPSALRTLRGFGECAKAKLSLWTAPQSGALENDRIIR